MMHRRCHALLLATTALMPCGAALAGGPPTPPGATDTPTGWQTVGGSATYTPGAGTLTVNQSSQNLITNWTTFNIGSSASVQFVQPNANAIALNRVVGDGSSLPPSQIMGSLSASGIVFLVNPNGVI